MGKTIRNNRRNLGQQGDSLVLTVSLSRRDNQPDNRPKWRRDPRHLGRLAKFAMSRWQDNKAQRYFDAADRALRLQGMSLTGLPGLFNSREG
jgi:hypothetical protein